MNKLRKHKKKCNLHDSGRHLSKTKGPDLTNLVEDRVDLLHEAFSVLKNRELRNMIPASMRNLHVDQIQELCLEELLGISSKRLRATLEGGPPPSDTDSSESETASVNKSGILDNLSLESISSDEGVIASTSDKKKKDKKCKRRETSKNKDKSKVKKSAKADKITGDEKQAERSGLTVLELLELQARARAIRAQLEAEQGKRKSQPTSTVTSADVALSSDEDDVQIKEEPAEVVELSSDEEKLNNKKLHKEIKEEAQKDIKNESQEESKQNVTKKNNLTIILPKKQISKKIKLNRRKNFPLEPKTLLKNEPEVIDNKTPVQLVQEKEVLHQSQSQSIMPKSSDQSIPANLNKSDVTDTKKSSKPKNKHRKPKKKKKVIKDVEGSDHDEISLQLSDSEKMDLLGNLDQKPFEKPVNSSCDNSSRSSSEDEKQPIKSRNDHINKDDQNNESLEISETNTSKEPLVNTENN